jgi:hypothetical protein
MYAVSHSCIFGRDNPISGVNNSQTEEPVASTKVCIEVKQCCQISSWAITFV